MTTEELIAEIVAANAIETQTERHQILRAEVEAEHLSVEAAVAFGLMALGNPTDYYVYWTPGHRSVRYQLGDENLSASEVKAWYLRQVGRMR